MRTNIDIDDELMHQAMAATKTTTKKGAVEHALRQVVQLKRQGEALEKLWGLATWVGPEDDWFAADPLALKPAAAPLASDRPALDSENPVMPERTDADGNRR